MIVFDAWGWVECKWNTGWARRIPQNDRASIWCRDGELSGAVFGDVLVEVCLGCVDESPLQAEGLVRREHQVSDAESQLASVAVEDHWGVAETLVEAAQWPAGVRG